MTNFLDTLFNIERYMPHGYCLLWQPELVWMHVISDVIITLAYFAIPAAIIVLLIKRKQTVPFRWVFVMFASFIILCGITHLVSVTVLWKPIYYLQGIIKALTAIVSIATAILLLPLIPHVLDLLKDTKQQPDKKQQ